MYLIISGSSIISGAEYVLKDYLENSSLQSQFIILASETIGNEELFDTTSLHRCYYSPFFGHAGAIATGRLSAWLKKGFRYVQSKKVINEIFENDNIRAVIGNNAGDIIYSRIIKNRNRHVKFILHVHEIIERKSTLGKILKYFDKHVNLYIAVSNVVKEKLIENEIDDSKIEVLYNGLKYIQKVKTKNANQNNFGFIGTIAENKKPISFIRFIRALSTQFENKYHAYMVFKHADPSLIQKINDEIKKHKLDIELIGEIKREEMKLIYQRIDFLFVPFVNDSFPTVILEAFNNGIPVIGRESGGIPELIENGYNGFLFRDENDFSMTIGFLEEMSTEDYQKLSQNANETIKSRFDIREKCRRLDLLLTSILSETTQI